MPALSAIPNTSFPLIVHTGLEQKWKAQKCLARTLNLKNMQCLILTVIGTLKIMFPVTKHILQMFTL